MARTWTVLVALALVACPAEKNATNGDATTDATVATTSEEPTTTSTTGVLATCSDQPQTDACCCFQDILDYFGNQFGTESICGVHPLCSPMKFTCADYDLNCADMTTEDEAAIDCSLQALAAGVSGRVSWSILGAGQMVGTYVELDLVGDGTLYRQGFYYFDGCRDTHAVQRLSLPAPAYYEGCLAETGWRARFDCLRAATFSEPLETCIPGSTYTSEHC